MTTEPAIIAPVGFTDTDVADWMREKSQHIDHLYALYAYRERLVDRLAKLDDEIDEYKIKSTLQI